MPIIRLSRDYSQQSPNARKLQPLTADSLELLLNNGHILSLELCNGTRKISRHKNLKLFANNTFDQLCLDPAQARNMWKVIVAKTVDVTRCSPVSK